MNPDIVRVEWHVNPRLHHTLRDKLLSKLIDLRNQGHITIWIEHWHNEHGQYRYKYVITLTEPTQSAHSPNPRSNEQTVY